MREIKRNKTKKNKKEIITDYYTFMNKKWLSDHKNIQQNTSGLNSFIVLQNKVDDELTELILKKEFKEKTKSGINTRNLYNSIINIDDRYIENQINIYIGEIQILRELNMYKMITWFDKKGIPHLFNYYISLDPKEPKKYTSFLQETTFTFKYLDNKEKIIYLKYLKDIFETIFGKNHNYNVNKIYEIEKEIYDKNKNKNKNDTYNKFNKEEIEKEFNLNWTVYTKELGFTKSPNEIIVENPIYIKGVMSLLNKKWNTDDYFNFWVYRIIRNTINMHSKLYNINYDFLSKISYIKKTNLKTRAIGVVKNMMNTEISKLYLKYYENKKEIVFVRNLIDIMIKEFEKRVKNNCWLSENSIEKTLLKLRKMKITIGSKSKWNEDINVEFDENNYFKNYEKYINWNLNKYIKYYYDKTPNNNVWITEIYDNVYDVNSHYININNELIIPNAILQKPFVDLNKSMAYNMANIGVIIGHEIMHGFDNEGVKYNENGVYGMLWNKDDIEIYHKKQIKINELYKKQKNNIFKLSENISDIGGFLIAEETLITYLIKKGINSEDRLIYLTDFYKYYAKLWKTIYNKKMLNEMNKYDPHSNSKFRTNCVLSISPTFREIYSIKENDIISKVITIW